MRALYIIIIARAQDLCLRTLTFNIPRAGGTHALAGPKTSLKMSAEDQKVNSAALFEYSE